MKPQNMCVPAWWQSRQAMRWLLALSIGGLFFPLRNCQFANYDDGLYVTSNDYVLSGLTWSGIKWAFTSSFGFYQPVTWLSLMFDVEMSGTNPGYLHLVNVCIHIVNVLLVFELLLRFTASSQRAVIFSAVFAFHPLNLESVAWISERKGLLAALFFLGSVCHYIRYLETGRKTLFWLSFAGYVCSLLSKPAGIGEPVLLLCLDFWFRQRSDVRLPDPGGSGMARGTQEDKTSKSWKTWALSAVLEKFIFFATAGIFALIAVAAERNAGALASLANVGWEFRTRNMIASYIFYLWKFFWPSSLAILYARPLWWDALPTFLSITALVLLGFGALKLARKSPVRMFALAWYILLILPVCGIVPIGPHYAADRYGYLPMIGLLLLALSVTETLLLPISTRLLFGAATLAAVLVLAAVTRSGIEVWRDSGSIWRQTLRVTAKNPLAENNYGVWLARNGRYNEALACYERALAINGNYTTAKTNVVASFRRLGLYQKAAVYESAK